VFYFSYDIIQKEWNTFIIYLLYITVIHFRSIIKKDIDKISTKNQFFC